MPTFPFPQLPPSLQEAITRKLEFLDLFFLSQCSKKSFDIVRTARLMTENSLVLRINIGYSSTITLRHVHDIFKFKFYNKRDPKSLDLENPRPYKIHGLARTIDLHQEFERSRKFRCASDISSSEIFLFIAQVMNLFNAKVSALFCDPVQMDCIKGLISIGALTECEMMFIDSGRVTHEEMNMILEGVQATEWYIYSRTDREFFCKTKIAADVFRFHSDAWFNLVNLLNCKQIDIKSSAFTNQDFNTFIRHWLNGTSTELEIVHHMMLCENKKNELDLAEIVKGLPTIPGTPKRQDATNFFQIYGDQIAYENGFDLKRSDGMLATVTVKREQLPQSKSISFFVFIVWHDPNPYLIAP